MELDPWIASFDERSTGADWDDFKFNKVIIVDPICRNKRPPKQVIMYVFYIHDGFGYWCLTWMSFGELEEVLKLL